MIKDPILNAVTFLMIPFIILFGLYIQFHGDYTPGGGFQAGIIIASGIILYSMLFGVSTTLKAIPYSVIRLTNVLGILIYGGTGVATTLLGQNFLSYDILLTNNRTGQKLGIFFGGIRCSIYCLLLYVNYIYKFCS